MIKTELQVPVSREKFFDVVSDVASYPEFLKNMKSVKILKESEDEFEAEFVINLIKEIRYVLRFKKERPTRLSWELVRGDLMKKNTGAWILEEGPSETRARYEIDVNFGLLVPRKIIEGLTSTQLPELMQTFKERAMSL
ncbi:MAG: type II toxin-antitoxin system RatA family toxin [Bdellovibrionota bacterium]